MTNKRHKRIIERKILSMNRTNGGVLTLSCGECRRLLHEVDCTRNHDLDYEVHLPEVRLFYSHHTILYNF